MSERHAGFVVNIGNATAKDVIELTEYVKKKVYEKFNKKIELEIENMHIIIDKIKIIQYYIGGLYIVGLYRHKIH